MVYKKLDFMIDRCPQRYTLTFLDVCKEATGTERDICWSQWLWHQKRKQCSSELCKVWEAGQFQRREPSRLTWYSNVGGMAKEIDRTLITTRWGILQNYKDFRSTDFFATDYRPIVTLIKHQIQESIKIQTSRVSILRN